MMKTFFTIFLFCLALPLYAQDSQQERWKQEILSVLDEQANAWNNGSIEGYMQGY
jgi:hypothetical protein